jgi:hypothetical protein
MRLYTIPVLTFPNGPGKDADALKEEGGERRRKKEEGGGERLTSGILKLNKASANPVIQSISQKAHLHPLATTANPATIGPSVGPAAHARSYRPIE